MRRSVCLALVLLALASVVHAAPAQKRETEQVSGTNTSITLAYSGNLTAGSLLVMAGRIGSGAPTTPVVSDSTNGSWTLACEIKDGANGRTLDIFYFVNSAGGVAPTVTYSWSGVPTAVNGLDIYEYTGMNTSSPLDGTPVCANPASTTTPSSGTTTTTNANDLIFGAMGMSSGNTTTISAESTGFTSELTDTVGTINHAHVNSSDRTVSATGSYVYQPTLSAAEVVMIGVVAFKTAGGGAAPAKRLLTLGAG